MPTHTRALGNKVYYEDELQKIVEEKRKGDDGSEAIQNDEIKPNDGVHGREFYEQMCRGEITLSDAKLSKLKCRYLNKNHPFLLIAPFKVEEAHHKPDIFIFHDVLADSEIATIRRMAQPRVSLLVIETVFAFMLVLRRCDKFRLCFGPSGKFPISSRSNAFT